MATGNVTRRQLIAAGAAFPSMQAAPAQGRPGAANSGPKPPNILFILADQLTPFMTGPYGCKAARTPHLDRLAREGVTFENAYCNSPLCVPSRASMWSGRMPSAIGSFDNGSEFPAHLPTIPYILRTAGYKTAVAGKCHFIGADQMHGFDERLTPCIFPAGFEMTPNWMSGPVYNRGTSIQQMFRALGPSKWNRQLAFDQHAFEAAMTRLGQYAITNNPEPLFLTVAFTQPHDPFTTTREFLDLYNGVDIPLPADSGDVRRLSPTYEWIIKHHGIDREAVPPEKVREVRRNYLGMISWVDSRVGMLLAELERLGLADDTAVVFASDHGEMMGDHGMWSKRLLLEWSARVPLLVRMPGKAGAGRRVMQPVSLVDLMPTLADLAGAKTEIAFDGTSLAPVLRGGQENRDAVMYSEYLGEGTIEPMRMVRKGRHKIITINGHGPQLFDLGADPGETANVSGQSKYAGIEKQMRGLADAEWDGAGLKKQVIRDQQERLMVRAMQPKWDYVAGTSGPYMRGPNIRN
jgi:choline-sulfatase